MYPGVVTKAIDEVDAILEQWSRERPEIDVSAMAIVGRISRLEKLIAPRLDTAFSRHGLESWEFDVLATLRRHAPPHQLTPGALIVASMITSSAARVFSTLGAKPPSSPTEVERPLSCRIFLRV